MSKNFRQKAGFTLIEIMLAVGLMTAFLSLSVPVFQSFIYNNDLDTAINSGVRALRLAQENARGMYYDDAWGVKFTTNEIVLFKGNSYASRDTSYDSTYPISTGISVSGTSEYIFAKFTGTPTGTGTVTLTENTKSLTITINEQGNVTY